MIDAVKDYLAPKRFGVVAYICLIIHFLCGLVFTAVTSSLRAGEFGKFSCTVDKGSTILYRTYVEKTCYSKYEQAYNSPLPLYGFVLLSTGIVVLVSVVYSLGVSSRVDEIERRSSGGEEPATADGGETDHGFHVFYFYFVQLVVRSIFGILFSVVQYTVLYPNGFDSQFICTLSHSDVMPIENKMNMGKFNYATTSVACKNSSASEKRLWSMIVCVLNTAFALIVLCEVIYLSRRLLILNCCSAVGWSSDTHFVSVYLLRKRYVQVQEVPLTSMHDNTPLVHITPDISIVDNSLQNSIDCYKHQVLDASRTSDICYSPNVDLDHLYIDVVIHSGRARHDFSMEMDRHEIFHVYMKVPKSSIRLEEIKDLFYPNEDTYGKIPHTILAVGRPGIGKTVLTQKIHHDWANGVDEFYRGKIAFFFKFRWFNFEELNNLSLKTFLRYGTGLSEEKFESIFEEVLKEPQKALLIFDGFDEFNGDLNNCFEQSKILPNDPTICTSAINLFLKLTHGNLLKGTTVIVTSRPTAEVFYSKINFERRVEIIGFTKDKIEEYVSRFCENNGTGDLKQRIWDHIRASSDLLNLCYIPVNCFIVCVTMTDCLSNPRNDTGALPTTLTELYSTAIDHFATHHNRNLDETALERIHKDLQYLAFRGMENGQLVFNKQLFDAQMKCSGLLNSLSNPIFPLQIQFCFIHLTIQEFLAARHVTETLPLDEIERFISTHIGSAKWHLVLQFIAGLLGEKTKMSASGSYHDSIMTFAKSFTLQTDKRVSLNNVHHILVMKCLREADDQDIAKQACEKTDLNHVTNLYGSYFDPMSLSTSDWAAVTFVLKHLKNLKDLFLENVIKEDNHFLDLGEFIKPRCLESLVLVSNETHCSDYAKKHVINNLRHSKCTLSHEHYKLSTLRLSIDMKDEHMSNLCAFLENENVIHLQELDLSCNDLTSCGISELCDVLNNDHCKQLRYLNLSTNFMLDTEGLGMLCSTIREHCTLLNTLIFDNCQLGATGVSLLCQLLCDEQCKLNVLSVEGHFLGDKVMGMLCTDALRNDECQLTELGLSNSYLTDECIPLLCETLQDKNCKLTKLSLDGNQFTEEGKALLHDFTKTEVCQARGFKLSLW